MNKKKLYHVPNTLIFDYGYMYTTGTHSSKRIGLGEVNRYRIGYEPITISLVFILI